MAIFFSEEELEHVTCHHEDVLVVTIEIDVFDVKRIIIDSGSSTDVLILDALKNMGKSEETSKR